MKPQEHDIMRSVEDHYWWPDAPGPLPGPVNTMLRGIAALELCASRHLSLPFGTSVFAVAQKKHG